MAVTSQMTLTPGANVIKGFTSVIYGFSQQLSGLSQTGLYSLVECFRVRSGANPKAEDLKGALLGQTPASPTDIRLAWRGLPGTNTLETP
jgi:hypothetical protein